YNPLYNGLIFLADLLPFFDAGVIIILFTIIVKIILFPLSKKAVRTQAMMKLVEPELKSIKEKYKNDKQTQAMETMKLYKEKKVNPFSSILLLLIQIPILWALYKIFYSNGLSTINADILYSFVNVPPAISTFFLDIIDVSQKNIWLAVIAAVSQYFQISLSTPNIPKKTEGGGFQEDFARSMHIQMKYVLPIIILFVSYQVAGALALYWATSNLFMIGQELYIRKQLAREKSITK
ncbi:MAG TPA: YidC/Oxa1 family membrane protein insertase, partial [Candidatus Paceibacterota bacterium]